jgi:hypothetical protein
MDNSTIKLDTKLSNPKIRASQSDISDQSVSTNCFLCVKYTEKLHSTNWSRVTLSSRNWGKVSQQGVKWGCPRDRQPEPNVI